ncbi:hypothetical protein ACFOTA_14340 [Chitinophaga sp. GCM10012297]|uniref:Uncharacterized protein n=1 Tax=Chitinophaga chungangae TaxID=2821488 RepID=A0ABS3YFC7_9BACT|nr:hypothetical protein [Chitinophaga chungangae]MBO9153396.1 hypothetical protein [Chitinophaga chungangae]
MSDFLRKALGLFVEFEPNEPTPPGTPERDSLAQKFPLSSPKPAAPVVISDEELDKFGQHFSRLFENSNLPGPDYFEFWRMMETLAAHLPDEKARIGAVFATLSVQGLTRGKLLETAALYKAIVEKDRAEFDKAADDKAAKEVEGRVHQIAQFEKDIAEHSAMIRELTEAITKAQADMKTLKDQVTEHERKIAANRQGYDLACDAMINKIETDIQKIQTTI